MTPFDRRDFLRATGAGAAGLWLGSSVSTAGWSRDESELPQGKDLIVHGERPFNAEGALDKLAESYLTPIKHFYVRCNGPIPTIKPDNLRLAVEGLVHKPLTLSLAELKDKFKSRTAVATLMCAGNRRSEHSALKKVGGVQWGPGPIGNARWQGAVLADVLRAAGLKVEAKHVWFESLDEVVEEGKTIHFGSSIPLEKALAEHLVAPGALLAHAMHDEPLRPEHGFPLRVVVPGFIGARSVKWLGKIVVSDRPSDNYFVARSYKIVAKGTPEELAAADPIYQFPTNSVICSPVQGAKVSGDPVSVSGYALAAGIAGRTISKVELSADGGKTWKAASFTSPATLFCWRLWKADLPLSAGKHTLIVRASDSSGETQPEEPTLNAKGYLFNAWHKVDIEVG